MGVMSAAVHLTTLFISPGSEVRALCSTFAHRGALKVDSIGNRSPARYVTVLPVAVSSAYAPMRPLKDLSSPRSSLLTRACPGPATSVRAVPAPVPVSVEVVPAPGMSPDDGCCGFGGVADRDGADGPRSATVAVHAESAPATMTEVIVTAIGRRNRA
ncbi:hypothetical protein GCM10017559_31990 [Streptosporangium longisporum]|uniref:Uncharacterized protein n=1 Tax=Streptosporangium longisporum TaxID=46187 RepID=A0ABP6KF01_9ACTN